MNQATLITLGALLADFYQDVTTIRLVLHDAGLDLSRIPISAAPLDVWDALLAEAVRSDKIVVACAIMGLSIVAVWKTEGTAWDKH